MYQIDLPQRASPHEALSDPKPIIISLDADNSESDKEAEVNLQNIIAFHEAHSAVGREVNQQEFHYQWTKIVSQTFEEGKSVL
ncbi:hypothetical protein A2U01_0053812, partial [Trifolium medium]|nr:hypothetical protein [Trifolium medium]